MEGLAGAAAGAALSSASAAERVDVFLCKVGEQLVKGRFGKVSFADGDTVEVLGSTDGLLLEAHAITRPSDRTIWMYSHCGRGSSSYRKYCLRVIAAVAFGVPALIIVPLAVYSYIQDDAPLPLWFWALMLAVGASLVAGVLAFVAARFTEFARLSDTIFAELGLDRPTEIDLHLRLREARRNLSHADQFNYHPYARWVYKY